MDTQNPWSFDKKTICLVLNAPNEEGPRGYEIDLEDCTTSAHVLDWIMQVASKANVSDRVLAWLVRDLNRMLRPQATLCSGGIEKGPIDVKKLLKRKGLI